jgi:small-conductance mechanosensitive channel
VFLGWFIGKHYKRLIYSIRKKYNISYSNATLLANMGYYTILAFSFLFSLNIIGIDLSSLAMIAGALSVGIGFGLQNIVSNFVSGLILMFEKTIKVDDYIQIDENTRGRVIDISMRSTVIRTNDNIDIIIPNQDFIQNRVINWTLGDEIVRFRIPFGVAYGTDIKYLEKVILEAMDKSNLPFLRKEQYKPQVIFIEMANSSLNFELFVWVRGEYVMKPRATRSEFLKVIYEALNEARIEIPFPQQDIHLKDPIPLEIKLKKD